jgi:hypothetical protein
VSRVKREDVLAWAVFIGGFGLELALALIDFPKVVIHIPVKEWFR